MNEPKTDAARRSVLFRRALVEALFEHLDAFGAPRADGALFTALLGAGRLGLSSLRLSVSPAFISLSPAANRTAKYAGTALQ
jgi:hypothetical protein